MNAADDIKSDFNWDVKWHFLLFPRRLNTGKWAWMRLVKRIKPSYSFWWEPWLYCELENADKMP